MGLPRQEVSIARCSSQDMKNPVLTGLVCETCQHHGWRGCFELTCFLKKAVTCTCQKRNSFQQAKDHGIQAPEVAKKDDQQGGFR